MRQFLFTTFLFFIGVLLASCRQPLLAGSGESSKFISTHFDSFRVDQTDRAKQTALFIVQITTKKDFPQDVPFIVALTVDGKVTDSIEVMVTKAQPNGWAFNVNGKRVVSTGAPEFQFSYSWGLKGHGASVGRLLNKLDQDYQKAVKDLDDFEARAGWDLATGKLTQLSYDEVKKLKDRETQLLADVRDNKLLLSGGPSINPGQLDSIIKKFVSLTVKRKEIGGTP